MATARITALTALAEIPANDDVFVLEDVSAGTTKKITAAYVRSGLASSSDLSTEVEARAAHEAAANPHSGSASTADLATVGTAVTTHVARTDNPHDVTAAQAGAISATAGAATPYVSAASETAAGISELSTLAEAVTGTDTARVITAAASRQAQISLIRDTLGKFPGIIPPGLNLFCGDATSDTASVGTFTRSTTGTRLGQTGLIETVAAGSVRREWNVSGSLLGWLIQGSRTNVVLYSRDLTNAIWTKTNCTAALSQTGIDGAAASASLLTATADAATCLQSITLASSNRFQTAYLKRIAGSGAVSMTMDGGATWTDITASLSTTAWTRVSIPVQTLANPSVGFRLATSGNAIAVDGVQNETGNYSTSNIATTSVAVARSSDVWTMPLNTAWFNTAAGTIFISGRTGGVPGAGAAQTLSQFDDGSTANRIYIYRDSSRNLYTRIYGTAVTVLTLGTVADLTTFRAAFSWSSSGFSASLNGGACITATATALPSGLTTLRIGSDVSGGSQWDGHILHDAYFPYALSDADKMAITL